jgi:hypothetical protein
MRRLKLLLFLFAIGVIILSCSSNTPAVSQTDITITPSTKLPTATFTFVPEPTHTPTITPINTPIPTISKTKVNLSPELYLDENSSLDNLQGEPNYPDYSYFTNGYGGGFIYHFGNEEWVVARTWTRILPFNDVDAVPYIEGELRQHYVQVWRDEKLLYSFPAPDISTLPYTLLRYDDHWIFWFMDHNTNLGRIVQDGILLNDLHGYANAFSLFLLDGKPFFFFQRGDQFGVSFNNQEILLPYSNISYDLVCCDNGGRRNPRGTNIMVGFYTQRKNSEYQYIEIGLR